MIVERFDRKKHAERAAERWKSTYLRNGRWAHMLTFKGKSEETYNQLIALGPNPYPDDVDRVIGNESWTQFVCQDCDIWATEGVIIDAGIDSDIQLCTACTAKLKARL